MSIRRQLQEACEAASFTQTDLAVWFEFDYRTVQKWLEGSTQPRPLKDQHIKKRLELLYRVVETGQGHLPVPPSITQYQRREYVKKVRDRALRGLLTEDTAG